jgi:hypothetical protein
MRGEEALVALASWVQQRAIGIADVPVVVAQQPKSGNAVSMDFN